VRKIVEEQEFYTCRNDRAFKEVFLNEKNEALLKKILELVLGVSIKEIVRENIERNQGNVKVRRKNLDILLNTDKGKIDIEMNAHAKEYIHARNLAYQCDNYSHNTLVGEDYTEEVQIIQINFTYGMKKKDQKILRKYYVQDDELKYANNFVIYEYNMDKIMEFWYSKDEENIEKYKYLIMLDLKPEELKVLSKKDRWVEKYKMDVEIINRDVRFREYISEEEDRRKCYNSEIRIATEKGIKKGLKKGKKEGMKENSIEVAKKMLQIPTITLKQIAECTNLSIEEIKALKEE